MTDIEGTAVRIAIGDPTQDEHVAEVAASEHAPVIPDDRLTKVYVKIREAKKAFVKAHEEELKRQFDGPLQQIAAELKARLQTRGNDGIRTEHGTVYLAEKMTTAGADWGVFYDWAKKNDCLENFLEQRIKVGEVKKYMDAHEGELPPGVSVFRELEARVRKPTKRGSAAVGDESEPE